MAAKSAAERKREGRATALLAERLVALGRAGEIDVAADARVWKSGVYALIDAVFRARARYASVVLPLLEERLPARAGMGDRASLAFSDWLADVAAFGRDPLERCEGYARGVLNRQRLGGRLKVEICCEAAAALAGRRLETARHLRALRDEAWAAVVRDDLEPIAGFGGLLARHLGAAVGRARPLAPERPAVRLAAAMLGSQRVDAGCVTAAIERAARRLDVPPARLDVALHRHAAGARRHAGSDGEET